MEESEKKIDLFGPEGIMLLILAGTSDAVALLSDLAILIPVVGIIIMGLVKIVSFVTWAIILFWFIMKEGFTGGPLLLAIAGGSLNFAGLPSMTLAVIVAIYLANHPKAAAAASMVTPQGKIAALGKVTKTMSVEKRAAQLSERTSQRLVSTPEVARARSASFGPAPVIYETEEGEVAQEQEISEEAFGMPAETFKTIEKESFGERPLAA